MPQLHFDHAVIFVPDLNSAIRQFSDMGFIVIPGGEHQHSCNALVVFADQTYIEILALKASWTRPLIKIAAKIGLIKHFANRKSDTSWRLMNWTTREYGAVDWCIRVDDMQTALDRFAPTKLPILDTVAYQRRQPDGQAAQWLLGSVKNLDLPFLIEDKTPMDIRIPLGDHTKHPNGALGVRKISLSPADSAGTASALNTLLRGPQNQSQPTPEAIALGGTILSIKEQQNIESQFSLELSYSGDKPKLLDSNKTYGAAIWLTPNS